MAKKKYRDSLKDFNELLKIQLSNGNWNYDEYMMGLANGMILAKHLVDGAEGTPPYKTQPKKWLKDLAVKVKPQVYKSK